MAEFGPEVSEEMLFENVEGLVTPDGGQSQKLTQSISSGKLKKQIKLYSCKHSDNMSYIINTTKM